MRFERGLRALQPLSALGRHAFGDEYAPRLARLASPAESHLTATTVPAEIAPLPQLEESFFAITLTRRFPHPLLELLVAP